MNKLFFLFILFFTTACHSVVTPTIQRTVVPTPLIHAYTKKEKHGRHLASEKTREYGRLIRIY